MKTLIMCLVVVASICAHGKDIAPQRALEVVNAFRMNSSSKQAHKDARETGLFKGGKQKVSELRIVSYGFSLLDLSRVKLVFYNDSLRGIYIRVAKGDDKLSKWTNSLRSSLGSPKMYGAYSDYHAGVNFDTCVYAEWPRYLLTISSGFSEKVWLERRR